VTVAPLRRPATSETDAQKPSIWHLTQLGLRAFRDQPQTRMQWPILRSLCLQVLLIVSVTTAERRVHPSADAFCLLTTRSRRGELTAALVGAALAVPILLLVAFLPIVFYLVVLALAVLLLPSALLSVRTRRPRRILAASAPGGPLIGVHTVTSSVPGHGAEVMNMVAREADSASWSLVLDAANERLADYYSEFGFQPCGEGVVMPWGERVVRMVRRPNVEGGR
jgi:hypothetical protein